MSNKTCRRFDIVLDFAHSIGLLYTLNRKYLAKLLTKSIRRQRKQPAISIGKQIASPFYGAQTPPWVSQLSANRWEFGTG